MAVVQKNKVLEGTESAVFALDNDSCVFDIRGSSGKIGVEVKNLVDGELVIYYKSEPDSIDRKQVLDADDTNPFVPAAGNVYRVDSNANYPYLEAILVGDNNADLTLLVTKL